MKTKFSIEVPFFPGFYGTMLDTDNNYTEECEYLQGTYQEEGFEITDDDIEFNYDGYKKNVAEDFVNALADILPKDIVKSLQYESISSPRYYNFANDKVYANIELVDDWYERMENFIERHKTWFISRLREDWTSRDGFHSFMENSVPEWLKMLCDGDERYIGTTLGYMLEIENPVDNGEGLMWNLCETALEDNYVAGFMGLTDDAEQRYLEFKKEKEEQERIKELNDKLQTKIDFTEPS